MSNRSTDQPEDCGADDPAATTRGDLEREILGESPSLTSAELVGSAHASLDQARQLWRALGFADAGDAVAFIQADVDAMTRLRELVDAGTVDFETGVRLTRAIGYTMARLADWQVSLLSERVEDVERSGSASSRLSTGLEYVRAIEPSFEHLMLYAWRRHLAAAVSRVEALSVTDADLSTQTATVGFADLVSFTRLSSGFDRDRLVDVVEGFESLCSDLVTARGGRVIKTLGDSILFVAGSPRMGVDIAADIVEQIGTSPDLPDVHVGLATGPVLMRLGDVFGSPVNLASRLTAVARRNRVICDEATARALRGVVGFSQRALTERGLRGFGMVVPITIKRLREVS